jgi:DNA-binding CsgD family transcriptional regulator
MPSPRRVDPIATVEAAYETTDDFKSWARGVLETTLPDLDRGFGVIACVIRASTPGSNLEVGAGPVPEGLIEASRAMTYGLSMSDHSLMYRPQVSTMSEMIPGFGSSRSAAPGLQGAWDLWNKFGCRDAIGVVAQADGDNMFVIGALSPRTVKLTPDRRKRLTYCAAHVGAAMRLRRAPMNANAVVRPDGVVEHAEGRAKEKGALEALRRRATEIDRARSNLRRRDPEAALSMWKALLDGEWSLVERFERDGRRYYIACENPVDGRGPRSLTERERQVVELACRGNTNKVAAYTLGLSEAATSVHLKRAMQKLGVRSRAELAVVAGSVGQ